MTARRLEPLRPSVNMAGRARRRRAAADGARVRVLPFEPSHEHSEGH